MKEIRMVDLKSQYENIKTEIDKAVIDVISSSAFINGPEVKNFEKNLKQYLKVNNVIPCASGTDSLQIAIMALGLKPGDQIITSSFTFVSAVEVIKLLGLTPVLVDIDPDTFNISPKTIEKAIRSKTKAIIPVHIFGQCADMEKIMNIAKKYNLFVIEDACQSISADFIFKDGTRKKSGTIGDIGCVSFFPSKNLGAYGDGGAIFTNNDQLAEKMKIITNHGMHTRYYYDTIGVNSRLDSIQAAILKIKLKYLDNYTKARNNAADYYDKALANNPKIKIPFRASYSTHAFHQYTITLSNDIDHFKLQEYLKAKKIPSMIYYSVPLHLQKAYSNLKYKKGDLPVTEKICNSVISLPIHTELNNEQLKYITTSVLEFIRNN